MMLKTKLVQILQKKKSFNLYKIFRFLLCAKKSPFCDNSPLSPEQIAKIVKNTNLIHSDTGSIAIPWMDNILLGAVYRTELPKFLKGIKFV